MKKKELSNIDRTSGIFFLERFAPGLHWHNENHGTWLNKRTPTDSMCSRTFEFITDGLESICIEPDCRHYGKSMGLLPYPLLEWWMQEMVKMEAPDWNPPQVPYAELNGEEGEDGNL